MRKRLAWLGAGVGVILEIWSRLAQISPDYFGVTTKSGWVSSLVTNAGPVAWLLIAVGVLYLLWTMDRRIDGITSAPAPPTGSIRIALRGASGSTVLLSEQEFDLGPGALEYFESRSASDQERIVRLMRRSFLRRKFTQEAFVIEVDESQRWRIRLDEFIGRGGRLVEAIDAEASTRRLRPPPTTTIRGLADIALALGPPSGLLAGLPDFKLQQLGSDVQSWQDDIYGFLKTERPGFAEEFVRPIDPPTQDLDPLVLLLHKARALIERLVVIKNAA